MRIASRAILMALVLTAIAARPARSATVPQRLTEQGRLLDKTTNMPSTGNVSMVFKIYDVATAGTALWTETFSVTLDAGYFSVQLGSTVAFPATLWNGSVRYIGVTVGSDAEMTPREEIASVPYAIAAGDAIGDIHPTTVSIGGTAVIDATGKWVGSPTGLMGPKGDTGAMGLQGLQGAAGVPCTNGCVNTASLANGAVTAVKIAAGALSHAHGLSVQARSSGVTTLPASGAASATALCPAGTALMAGGCNFVAGVPLLGGFNLVSSYPTDAAGTFNPAAPYTPGGWFCYYENTSTSAGSFLAYAVCASVAQTTLP